MRQPPTDKLAKVTLKLIAKDLKRIQKFKVEGQTAEGKKTLVEPPPGMFSQTLSRYLSVLMNLKRTTEKLEDEQRAALRRMSTKQLEELAKGEG